MFSFIQVMVEYHEAVLESVLFYFSNCKIELLTPIITCWKLLIVCFSLKYNNCWTSSGYQKDLSERKQTNFLNASPSKVIFNSLLSQSLMTCLWWTFCNLHTCNSSEASGTRVMTVFWQPNLKSSLELTVCLQITIRKADWKHACCGGLTYSWV